MRGLRFFLIVGLACVYFMFLRSMFRVRTEQATQIMSIPAPAFERVVGNHGLMCLLFLRNGEVEMVDAGHEIDTRRIAPSPGTQFKLGSLSSSGVGYLLDDKNTLYRVTMGGNRATSKPIAADGQILAMAVQEKRSLLWLVVKRQSPHPDDLFVLTIGLVHGKILSAANLGNQGSPVVFETTGNGENVLLTTDASPSLYAFDYKEKTLLSKAVGLRDLATSIAYNGDYPVLGLRSGGAVMLDPETWRETLSVDTGQYKTTAVEASENAFIGIGHGASNDRAETGSFQFFDQRTREVRAECVARSEVTAAAGVSDRFLYGADTGVVNVISTAIGCAELDIPKANRPGPVRFMSSAGIVCLIVGERSIVRLLFRIPPETLP